MAYKCELPVCVWILGPHNTLQPFSFVKSNDISAIVIDAAGAACLLFGLTLYYNDGYILYETENLVILDE